MVCYVVPAAAAVVVHYLRKSKRELKENVHYYWLNLLLFGAAIFGIVDHLWNGELFLMNERPLMDLALGVTITLVVAVAWGFIVTLDKAKFTEPSVVQ